jgi:hypothetical protein
MPTLRGTSLRTEATTAAGFSSTFPRRPGLRFAVNSPTHNNATVEECIDFIVERFAFVGLVEMYPLSVRLVTRLMEQERSPTLYVRKTEDNDYNQFEVTPELLDRVREINSLDVILYDYFHDKLSRIRDQVFSEAVDPTEHARCSGQPHSSRS